MNGKSPEQGRFRLPSDTAVYRTIGPFGCDSLPKGLLREHRLKEGTWARVRVLSGNIRFVWDDDGTDYAAVIVDGETMIIPPTIPHHLELLQTDFVLEIDFLERKAPESAVGCS
jgi:cupin 2 domain-containing protein